MRQKVSVIIALLTLFSGVFAQEQPLLQEAGLTYLGAFTTPADSNGGDLSFAGMPLAYNPAKNSLFIGNRAHNVAEITIPEPVITTDVKSMNRATWLQGFKDPTEGHWAEIGAPEIQSGGLTVVGDELLMTATIFYDANAIQQVSHFRRSTDLSKPSFSGFSRLTGVPQTGYVAGWMGNIPTEWQSKLGGNVLTGECCVPIVTRTSNGMAAFGFDSTKLGQTTVPASPLLYYTMQKATLGAWEGSNPIYGATTQVAGVAVIGNTRTVLYVGRNGLGPHCYGDGTANKLLHGTPTPDGTVYCYDPTSNSKGSHAYPYRYQVWAYDLNDLAAVKAGTKEPWSIVPYGVWVLPIPIGEGSIPLAGVGYDSQKQLLYVAQFWADVNAGYVPLVHVFKIDAAASTLPPVPPTQPGGDAVLIASLKKQIEELQAQVKNLEALNAAQNSKLILVTTRAAEAKQIAEVSKAHADTVKSLPAWVKTAFNDIIRKLSVQ
jgi:hypothetical protein